jgi:hypothetical protein
MKTLFMVLAGASIANSQVSFFQMTPSEGSTLPLSNSVVQIERNKDSLWFATGKGLSLTYDNGASWQHFRNKLGFDDKGISAIAQRKDMVVAAAAYTTKQGTDRLPAGGGIFVSTDRGSSWKYYPQPRDAGIVDTISYGVNRIRSLAITTEVNNITYDIAITDSAIFIASFAGMLRMSTDKGASWKKVVLPPDHMNEIRPDDTLDFDLSPTGGSLGLRGNLNHRVFSVFAANDSTLWVGTAGGINLTTDRGRSWRKFSHSNQLEPISGNFVVAIREQVIPGKTIVWAATIDTDQEERRGVSFSDNNGLSWKTTLLGEFAHDFAFRDSVIYVVTDRGLFRSTDTGTSWMRAGVIHDHASLQRFVSDQLYAVATKGDTVWVGGPEGAAYTVSSPTEPFGLRWKIFRAYQPVASAQTSYAYPTPFSPDDEPVRIRFSTGGSESVTIRIFDFAMQPVRTLLRNAPRLPEREYDEVWDGNDDNGRRVANGIYFYRIELGGTEPLWGKIFVLQ